MTATGFKWGSAADLSDGVEVVGDTLAGEFTADLTGLVTDSTLYYVAYVTNALGTTYGDTVSFIPSACAPLVFDGYMYDVVKIGNQCWFAENLRSDNYANGTPIPGNLANATWVATTEGAQSIYGEGGPDEAQNLSDYGRVYNWHAVSNAAGLCPTGWHVPTDAEFSTLEDFLGGQDVAGGKMRSDPPLWTGTNSSGWSGLPAGYRDANNGAWGSVYNKTWWWTSSGGSTAWSRRLNNTGSSLWHFSDDLRNGYSIRCLQDSN